MSSDYLWEGSVKGPVSLYLAVLWIILIGSSNVIFAQVSADSIWTPQQVRTDRDRNDTLDYLGREVTIAGVANIGSGILHEQFLQSFVQNDSSGISIFAKSIDRPFEPGDSLVVNGTIQRYNGLAEVHVTSYSVYPEVTALPAPKPLEKAVYSPESYLGMLVEGEGKIIEKGTTFNGKYFRLAPSDTTGSSMMVYVSNFHRDFGDFDFDVLSIGDEVQVKGVVSEYNPEFPRQRTFKLFLRTPSDLQYGSFPRYYLWFVIGGLLLLSFFVVGWILMLRSRVEKKTDEIKKSLEEKDVLLREIHHRVKNSLSIISGLIELQLDRTEDRVAERVLKDSQSRIHSMALIHDKLYKTDSLSDIKLDEYLKELVTAIHGTFSELKDSVRLVFNTDSVEMDIDRVVPCGLLINELVVNAFKHAFKNGREGVLTIELEKLNGQLELSVADNGPGLPDDFSLEKGDSLGGRLIATFARQLDAETEIEEDREGTVFTFRFPLN